MKVKYYQSRDELLSINLLFNNIRLHLPATIHYAVEYFTYEGAGIRARVYDVLAVICRKNRQIVHHVIGDFNYATFFLPGNATILTIHDLYRFYISEGNWLKRQVFKWAWLTIPVAKATVVTTVSQCTREELLKYVSCPPEKIRVIYNCISPAFYPAPKLFNKQQPTLLQVGTRPNKNLDRLILALEDINCKLEIIGTPSATTLQLMVEKGIRFNWSAGLTQEQVVQKYIACDMVVFVSVYEGFGLPIIEANTVERAVVTGNVSAMAEIAGNAACLVDPLNVSAIREGIMKVIEDDHYRNNLLSAGRINRERFLATTIASQYAELYKEVYNNATVGKGSRKPVVAAGNKIS